jgi:hypothetical protein
MKSCHAIAIPMHTLSILSYRLKPIYNNNENMRKTGATIDRAMSKYHMVDIYLRVISH